MGHLVWSGYQRLDANDIYKIYAKETMNNLYEIITINFQSFLYV
jgi:hypothetical protein